MYAQLLKTGEALMKKSIEKMRSEFSTLRTGRASASLVENIKVESYGTQMPISQMANLGVPDPRTIEIRPWDVSQVSGIEKAILKSELGLPPANDGKVIRLSIPTLTEDRRKELIKVVHKMTEGFKVSIRNERREIHEKIKKAEKEKQITEDDRKKGENELQKLTDIYVKKADELMHIKEKEVMEI